MSRSNPPCTSVCCHHVAEPQEDAARQARDAGLTVEIGGSALDAEEEPGGTTELIGVSVSVSVAVVVVVLVVALGSLVAAGWSPLTALLGVAIAFGLVSAPAVPLGLTSAVAILALMLMLMLGLAVGIDYALCDHRHWPHKPPSAGHR